MSEDIKTLVQTVAGLVETIKGMPGVQQPIQVDMRPSQQPTADEIRADKVQRVAVSMRKSNRVKPFKYDSDILVFLKRFQEELTSIKSIHGMNND